MRKAPREKVVIVTRASALDELVAKFNTVGQTKFYLSMPDRSSRRSSGGIAAITRRLTTSAVWSRRV